MDEEEGEQAEYEEKGKSFTDPGAPHSFPRHNPRQAGWEGAFRANNAQEPDD